MAESSNVNLLAAKRAKNDEFYTQYADIEAEMNAYVEHDPDVFRDKVVLCPCDDPEWSNFTKYFAANFERFGLRRLISTSYARSAGSRQLTLFESTSPVFDQDKRDLHGKLFVLDRDQTQGRIDSDDLELVRYLDGDGDFRSEEVTALRDTADMIVTNPPFSLFREFLAWIREADKDFCIVGSMNAITYKEVFPSLKGNDIWLGTTHPKEFMQTDGTTKKFGNIMWYTNLDHGKRHEWLTLDTWEHNLKFNKRLVRKLESAYGVDSYPTYDNYDAIEVPFTDAIPSDYEAAMGVPITLQPPTPASTSPPISRSRCSTL